MAKAKSALPQHYQPQLATLVKKLPRATFGFTRSSMMGTGLDVASIEALSLSKQEWQGVGVVEGHSE
jgi:hypothetical protein